MHVPEYCRPTALRQQPLISRASKQFWFGYHDIDLHVPVIISRAIDDVDDATSPILARLSWLVRGPIYRRRGTKSTVNQQSLPSLLLEAQVLSF